MADEERLLRLSASVSDGRSVDWARAEAEADDAERPLVRQLRLLAQIDGVYRDEPASGRAPEKRWGRLERLERVADGGFGSVYRAWDPRLERAVALKLLRPELGAEHADTLLEEGRLLARVRHPNVVSVFGADRVEGRVGIWMELIHGRTLEEVVRSQGPFGAAEAALIALDVCRALAAVHAAGLVHRDVKAQNVMREDGGRIVLMDFGLVASAERPAAPSGTPYYMAPELLLSDRPPDARSDLYALGVLLYHLVTGAFPVVGDDVAALRESHARRKRRRLRDARPELPAAFVEAVERATSFEPERRYASAAEMEEGLARALTPDRPAARVSRWRRPATAIAVSAVAVGWALWSAWHDAPRPAAGPAGEGAGAVASGGADLAEGLSELAGLYQSLGAYDQARALYGRALAEQERRLGRDHVDVARTLTRLAWVAQASGAPEEARPLYERARAIYVRHLGPAASGELERLRELAAARPPPVEPPDRPGEEPVARVDPFVPPLAARGRLSELRAPREELGPYAIEAHLRRGGSGPSLEVEASQWVSLYVLAEAEQAGPSLLFPLPGGTTANPLAPRTRHRLALASPGAGERLLVIASPRGLVEFETEVAALRLPTAATVTRVPLSAATALRLRRSLDLSGSASASLEGMPEAGSLFDVARPVSAHVEIVRGAWIRRLSQR